MTNPLKGEVDLVVGEASYALRLTIDSIVQMETMLDMGVLEIATALQNTGNPRLGFWRVALWAALRDRHPELSLEEAGEMIMVAKLPMIITKVGEAMAAAFPSAEPGAEKRPRKASRGGTGKPSA